MFAELRLGRLPILLGGDHSLSIGSISARRPTLPGGGQEAAGVVVGCARGFQHQRALSERQHSWDANGLPVRLRSARVGGNRRAPGPAITPSCVRQIGIRSVDAGEKRFVHDQGLDVFDMRYIDEMGMRETMEHALAGLDSDTHLHVSFDVDFLDPDIAPGVGTTVAGGPTYREAQLCMEMIADTRRLGSLDIVELNPAFDVRNKTAALAVDLVESLFGKSTLVRRPVWKPPLP